MAACIAVPI